MNWTINLLTFGLELVVLFSFYFLSKWIIINLFCQKILFSRINQHQDVTKKITKNLSNILFFGFGLLFVICLGFNSWLIYKGEKIDVYTINLITNLPQEFWLKLTTGVLKSILLVFITTLLIKELPYGLTKACNFAKNLDNIKANDESIEKFFNFLEKSIFNSAWLLTAALCSQFMSLPEIVSDCLYVLLKINIIFSLAVLVFRSINVLIDTLNSLSLRYAANKSEILRFYERFNYLIPFLIKCLEAIVAVLATTLIIQQIKIIANLANFGPKIIASIGIVFVTRVLIELSKILIEEILLKNSELNEDQIKRQKTFLPLLENIFKYVILFFSLVFILYVFDINPLPILAAAGILALGVSLAAQSLLTDIIGGFFIVFENYFLVGDYVKFGDIEGEVEAIELRTVRIKHPEGYHQIVHNSDIKQIINYNKQNWNIAIVKIALGYNANLDKVYELIEQVGRKLKEIDTNVLEPTKVSGVTEFRENDLIIATETKVKAVTGVMVSPLLRKMLKEAFEKEGIRFPSLNATGTEIID